MKTPETPVIVYAECTPNPASMKFVANKLLIGNGTAEYTSAQAAKESPFVTRLFNFPFVAGVFIAGNFITITKNNLVEWADITTELREFIKEYLSSGSEIAGRPLNMPEEKAPPSSASEEGTKPETEIEKRIAELLEEYIRPAVEQDGGAIHFRSFENGTLKVALRGSCSGCPSSAITLKAGIEGLFRRMLPEVKEVIAEEN